ncbi:phosphonate metabolism transcriptional regulator PhnF [Rhizobium sp. Leaf384]|uniref:phosphonate metabolism transcriptional regulator PhnF n=1 Tax=unclassified Rhizobium TaxID=2613769 RepID=UPI000712A6A8|nr:MULTISPECIES: phosphonate metabolism transcriptional regulator PhnF [unclassified Rhizobium]KQS81263.1 phosphonate metabolism transcriptional regulator PhnF [Rhizobium sp. Leaf384]KQS87171.1 phosphonate metabolism transcriptional regulator PhnF [Rhizobium sp. Leaf383]
MDRQDDGVSRWRRVADGIRASITSGAVTARLPPETDLAADYGVNRHTVRRAIAALAAEGVVRAERGRGTFVNPVEPRISYPIGTRARFSENMMRQSLEPSGRLVGSQKVVADMVMARLLGLAPGAPLHRLDHMAVVDGVPLSRSTSHFSAARFPGIIAAYAQEGSITQALQRCGLSDYRRRETRLTAERIAATDADALSCAADAIVLVANAVDVDLEGRPVQAIRTRFLADRMELVFSNPESAR